MSKAKGYVPLEIGGKTLNLKFDFNAIADAEEALRRPMSELVDAEGNARFGLNEVRVLLYVAAQGKLKSKREAGALLDFDNFEEATGAILEALMLAFPEKEEAAAEGEA